jgi:hypothetical protein
MCKSYNKSESIYNHHKNLLFLRCRNNRGVAQLVAYYVRDVGAGSSSLLTPTNEKPFRESGRALFFRFFESLLSNE